MDASIVIPVKNGGELFSKVLSMLYRQETIYSYEVIVVDSGSTDNSVQYAKEAGCRVYQISPNEFGHGRTRNLGASYGTGEFILFLTQDALPASTKWLQNFIDAMKLDSEIAGGFGKHLPYPGTDIPDQQMLEDVFNRYGTDNFIHQLTDDRKTEYYHDAGYRQYLSFFSDNNSCLRRSVWEKIPYDDVDFAEDQVWARKILEAGYKKVYCPYAAVYHSHSYPLKTYKKRYYDEFKGLYRVQGANFAPSLVSEIKSVLKDTKYQCSYIKRRNDLNFNRKIYWYMYSLRRNIIRYSSARKAVKYFKESPQKQRKMDKKYSQQYDQINS